MVAIYFYFWEEISMIEQTVDNALTGNEAAAAAPEMMRATREKLRAEALAREEEQFIADERRRAALEAGV